MKVKEIQRTANIAWSPAEQHPIYIAAGTAAQQLDATFSTSAAIEIYALNFADHGQDVKLCGTMSSDVRYHKLAWSPHGITDGEYCNGLLVGGADGGHFYIWSPEKILQNAADEALLFESTKHVGPVQAIDFNPFQVNLMASGASDSEIYLWDFNKPDSPMTPGTKSQPSDDVSCLAWNRQVQHILASTFNTRCVVWDLRKSEPIIKVSEGMSRIKSKLVAWHPEIATQMVLTSEDDHTPVIQLWDLRFATSPLKLLENHQRGVLSCAWCAEDPDLLLTCGKDNRILCWNPSSSAPGGEVTFELPTSNQWSYDVQWCPRNPSIISSCAFDGHISIYSLLGGETPETIMSSKVEESFPSSPPLSPQDFFNQQQTQQHQSQTSGQSACRIPLKRPPKWLRRPVGARFGFGGKLVMFERTAPPVPANQQPQQQPAGQPMTSPRYVTISQVRTEYELLARSEQLESALTSGQLDQFCEIKAQKCQDKNEKDVWNFLKTKFEAEPRQKFLQLLGYSGATISKKISGAIGEGSRSATPEAVNGLDNGISDLNIQSSENEFEFIAQASQHTLAGETDTSEPFDIHVGDDVNGLINLAILTGKLEDGVRICAHNDRWTEALILAAAGGSELLAKTQRKYLKATEKSNSLISTLVNGDFTALVERCDLKNWKEVLAVVLTYSPPDSFNKLCDSLGDRLEKSSLSLYAPLCYICSGNVDHVVRSWAAGAEQKSSPKDLQDLIEKVIILRKSVEYMDSDRADADLSFLSSKMRDYAELLASQGSLESAISYLRASNGESSMVLNDRLMRAIGQQVRQAAPFNVKPVAPEGGQPAPQPATYNSRANQQPGGFPRTNQRASAFTSTANRPYQPDAYSGYGGQVSNSYPGQTPAQPAFYNPAPQPATGMPPYGQNVPPAQTGYQPTPSYGGYDPGSFSAPSSHPNIGRGNQPSPRPDMYNPGGASGAMPPIPTSQPPPTRTGPAGDQVSNRSMQSSFQEAKPATAWNDPPAVSGSGSKRQHSTPTHTPSAPITTPIYNPAAGYTDPAMPPGVGMGMGHHDQGPPGGPNMMQQQPAQMYQPQQPAYEQPKPKPAPVVEKPKANIPAENQILQDVFGNLTNRCIQSVTNPHMRRKLEDVNRKLELLYDKLRTSTLSSNVIMGLHTIIQYIQRGDYDSALHIHTQMISQGNFTEISPFMPGIKVLLQMSAQHNVLL